MFKVVKGYEFAEVNEEGQVRSSLTKNICSPYKDKDGYLRCTIWDGKGKSRGIYVHRAVAIAFVPNPLGKPLVNHINSIRDDNRIENLEWVTPHENSLHGVEAGNFPRGENAFSAKYSDEQIIEVCELLERKMSSPNISRITGIPVSTIDGIRSGQRWSHISESYHFKDYKPKITDCVALEIKRLLSEGKTYKEIIKIMDNPRVNRHTVGNIDLGKTFKHLN